ncbi:MULTISPECIES: bifunctional glutamate N-acetyltransferase/amino-acid acetyltransferase ArgJ [Hydrocarboniphaga]|uniref:Arginine biosynthesis bifunctional protein ArgJ n=1 Tax=Hydrocarboniphaga effusa AP103 TaxID=1172194 RepID=I7ZK86_9GAMM|nr:MULTISPECIES: bifunctional glutamate N-acetyltransferase/amino-acid acetyltransferase ArgJ [Hydrocarboniphaga]EIT72177.1 ornithine acetyltransferase/N-acetylglutamate synthase protein [Hydrocarboniphaga effusa AP103]MDZ4079686.1 bifunctional glutamate N-acetyltransferase/amino-acid acetyltransferase ArgJ [Hydrocarboniphaga sp.]
MAVAYQAPESLPAVAGVRLGVAEAAIKKPGRRDLLVIELAPGTRVAGVFTQNSFAAAPVLLCREVLASGTAVRALVVNSGNANAATGQGGLDDARAVSAAVAAAIGCEAGQVLPFSTGVIGQRLPVERMVAAAPKAVADLSADGWIAAMLAIMTTDTVGKGASRKVATSQGEVTVTGIAKGVGMIHPNMATMLGYVGTDARLSQAATEQALKTAVSRSFNCVTVDGDTSTNDSCVLFATGQVGTREIETGDADYALVAEAIEAVCRELAHAIVRDGEGATKFVTIEVSQARSEAEARQVALAVAHSPLVKTALFASDANWGRIVMAVGKSGVAVDPAKVDLWLDEVCLLRGGQPHPDYREERGSAVVAQPEFAIRIALGSGDASATVWTCDFSYDYVKINAEYRT